jgi:hypothetical protein
VVETSTDPRPNRRRVAVAWDDRSGIRPIVADHLGTARFASTTVDVSADR